VDEADLRARNATYRRFVELGRAPSPAEVAAELGTGEAEVAAAWRRLHDGHALVLDRAGGLLMAHPFSAVPTAYRVQAAGRSWFANCAWDAFGVCAALHADGDVESACPDCGDPIAFGVRDGRPTDGSLRFHCLVPAAHWWDDIVHT
jgi:hypothetical protein